jgi:hypothetical protein
MGRLVVISSSSSFYSSSYIGSSPYFSGNISKKEFVMWTLGALN